MIHNFSNVTIDKLKYYVYVYSDPDTKKPFYVGKGKGNRVFNHLDDQSESEKVKKIKEIRAKGKEPIIEILVHGLDEETALKVEAAVIDLVGIENLTNIQRGHGACTYGKIEASTLEARYVNDELKEDDIKHYVIIIKINQLYRNDMTPLELYDATRGYWKIDPERASKADYVFAVYEGMVIEVYKPLQWFKGLSTFSTRTNVRDDVKERYEFVGSIAEPDIRNKYIRKSVAGLFSNGEQNPIRYCGAFNRKL